MATRLGATGPRTYGDRLGALIRASFLQVIRPPSHSHRTEAGRVLARRTLFLAACATVAIVVLMFAFDATEITWMPRRGAANLWPLRIINDFGKFAYVLSTIAVVLGLVALIAPRLRGVAYATLIAFGTRIQFVFLAVLFSGLTGEVLKGVVGRGRPFVGGQANAFNFSHFNWTESYASFPSGHAITSCALAFAISALWPRLRAMMLVYAIAIIICRLVLLAHHPSDVLGGALIGVLGAMAVRYWFAARRLAFAIRGDGSIVPLQGPTAGQAALAARAAFSP